MTRPDYRRFASEILAHPQRGPEHAEVFNDAAANIVQTDRMIRVTGGDPEGIDDAIDAQIDRVIAASDGDIRLALFAALSAHGVLMTEHYGPRG